MFKKKLQFCLTAVALCFTISLAQAHSDHQEIQVKSTFQVNDRQQLSALRMVWLYDAFSSQDMLSHEKDIKRLAKLLVDDLARFNFFTRINSGNKRLVVNILNQYKVTKVKDKDNNLALQLSITLLFNQPENIKNIKEINIDHSDPTGRTILYYDKAENIVITNELKAKCRTQLKEKAEFVEGKFPQIAKIICTA